jgi:hypothetical protein
MAIIIVPKTKNTLIPLKNLKNLVRTKQELYNLFKQEGGYYLPPISKTPLQFLKDVLIGKKELLKTEEIFHVERSIPI